jgi:hypothetical protein
VPRRHFFHSRIRDAAGGLFDPTNPPTITVNGANPAVIEVGASYADLGATVSDIGPGQAGDTHLGYQTFLNGTLVSNIVAHRSGLKLRVR